jgi:hypothetical protein
MNEDARAIRDLVQHWVVWRDAGDWDRFATVWHDDGVMTATWFQGPAADFIAVSREGFERGVRGREAEDLYRRGARWLAGEPG